MRLIALALALPLLPIAAAAQPGEAPPPPPPPAAPATEAPAPPAATPPDAAPVVAPAAPASEAAQAAPASEATPAAAIAEPSRAIEDERPDAETPASEGAIEADNLQNFALDLSGYLRSQYTQIEDDPFRKELGRNDGFVLQNARFIVDAFRGDVLARLSVDFAYDRRDGRNTSVGQVETRLRDAYLAYEALPYLRLRVGQFKPPFDAEELQSTGNLLFIERAVESRGVQGVEGINVDGMSLPRQVGVMLYSEPLMLEDVPLGLAYFLSATNGVDAAQPVNDNDALAYTGRLELYWGDMVTLGGGFHYNERTLRSSDQQGITHQDDFGIAADLSLDAWGLILFAQYMRVDKANPDVAAEPGHVEQGYHVQLGYRLPFGIIPAYRYAAFDPFAEFDGGSGAVDDRQLQYHTLALTWLVPDQPLKLQVNYTITLEEEGRELENDRLDALAQVSF